MQKLLKIVVFPVLFIVLASQLLRAEDDAAEGKKYRLPGKCQHYFLLAQQHRTDTLGIVYSDSMRMEALKYNHHAAYVISFLGACYYHCSTYNISMMETSAQELRSEALKANDLAYYYASYNILVDAHVSRRAFSNAIQLCNELYEESEKRKDIYGMWSSARRLSEIYQQMGNVNSSRDALRKSIDLWPKLNKPSSVTYLYCRLARIEPSLPKQLEIINEGLRYAVTYFDSAQVNTAMLRYYAQSREFEKYHQLYDKVISHPRFPSGYSQIQRVEFEAFDRLGTVGKDSALAYLIENEELIKRDFFTYMKQVNMYADDYEEAYYWHEKEDSVFNAQQSDVLVNDIYTYNSRVIANRVREAVKEKDLALQLAQQEKITIEAQRARVEAENARLAAEKQRAETERQRTQAEAERRKAQIKLMESEAESNRIRLRAEQQNLRLVEAENRAEHIRSNMIILIGSVAFLLVVFILALNYAHKQRKLRMHIEELNENLREAQAAAEHAEVLKQNFMQNISHEIRTPMNAIMGFTQLLTIPGMEVSDEEKAEYSQHINDNVGMLHMLVEDMLNASDIETGRFNVTLRNAEIQRVCEAAGGIVSYRIPGNVKYSFINELPEGFTCATDSSRVQQVIVNFLTNACKHTAKGTIQLHATHDAERKMVILAVTDTGIGVPKEMSSSIFERFTKVNTFKQGMGLGLNICRAIAEKLHGRVWLDTTYTTGARFCFEFPSDMPES